MKEYGRAPSFNDYHSLANDVRKALNMYNICPFHLEQKTVKSCVNAAGHNDTKAICKSCEAEDALAANQMLYGER